jgi:RNA-directed DNA polymerase
VAMHAERHRKANFLVRLDIQNFFPSITDVDVRQLLVNKYDFVSNQLADDDIDLVCRLVCRATSKTKQLALTIGAPSSPAISNAVLFDFDSRVANHCEALGVTYTRYADDMYFSTNEPNILEGVIAHVRATLNEMPWPKLKLNEDKTVFTSRKRRRIVTGITLTSDKKLSIGRDAKRHIRTQVYLCLNNQLQPDEIAKLKGRLSYYRSVEPGFLKSLINKFGEDEIYKILDGTF